MDDPITDKDNFPPKSKADVRDKLVYDTAMVDVAYSDGYCSGYCQATREILTGIATLSLTVVFVVWFVSHYRCE